MGFGVFMGIFPIWGFQIVTAIALSFLFRLNKALVLTAANISIPPMWPLIIFLSHLTGGLWLGDEAKIILFSDEITWKMVEDNFLQYVLGATTLALTSGIGIGGLTYLLLKTFKQTKSGIDTLEDGGSATP